MKWRSWGKTLKQEYHFVVNLMGQAVVNLGEPLPMPMHSGPPTDLPQTGRHCSCLCLAAHYGVLKSCSRWSSSAGPVNSQNTQRNSCQYNSDIQNVCVNILHTHFDTQCEQHISRRFPAKPQVSVFQCSWMTLCHPTTPMIWLVELCSHGNLDLTSQRAKRWDDDRFQKINVKERQRSMQRMEKILGVTAYLLFNRWIRLRTRNFTHAMAESSVRTAGNCSR